MIPLRARDPQCGSLNIVCADPALLKPCILCSRRRVGPTTAQQISLSMSPMRRSIARFATTRQSDRVYGRDRRPSRSLCEKDRSPEAAHLLASLRLARHAVARRERRRRNMAVGREIKKSAGPLRLRHGDCPRPRQRPCARRSAPRHRPAFDFAGHFNRLVSLRFPLAITLVTIALAIAAGFGVVRLKVDDSPAETNFRIPR